jgi:Tfp pilus assembly protein PilF
VLILAAVDWIAASDSYAATNEAAADEIRIVRLEGTVQIFRGSEPIGVTTRETNQVLNVHDRLRVGRNSRVSLRWSDQSVVTFDALTEIEILPPQTRGEGSGLRLIRGLLSFFHRETPGRIRVITRGAVAGVEGTEFAMAVEPADEAERVTLWVIDGKVRFSNEQGALDLTSGEQAVTDLGKPPVPAAGFIANNVLQWCFYYPAVVDPAELPLTPEEQGILAESLAAYRDGDLPAALAKYPAAREPGSDAERVYYAAVLLSVGQVAPAEGVLSGLAPEEPTERPARAAAALRQLISAVKRQPTPSTLDPVLSTELLAGSYYEQSRATGDDSLSAALRLARQAVTNSPEFSFAWARVAELEFSFGRTERAIEALDISLRLAPRNAQALALMGFLLAAENETREAIEGFDRAIAVDSGLGNAWLGRGLCRIRRGDRGGGREDLLVAAAIEPQRAVLRSYLSKAYAVAGDYPHAAKEIQLAKALDLNDPTAWLYSALLNQERNRINDAIRDLEKSQELNENRAVYRSRLLLDQDRAVRSANLARLYADADLGDVAVREAGRGVTADYANYSAHAFLANSYEVERRANLSSLRFEALSFNEYLLANLLGPANGRLLAQPVTQLEYSGLFDRDRLGLIANTEYFSRGAWYNSSAQYGTWNGSSYSLEAEYRTDPGERVNQDLEIRQLEGKFKHDLTPDDSVYLHVINFRSEGGDITQHFDEQEVSRTFRFDDKQTATVLAGYHHQWSPQNHTLFLAGRFDDELGASDPLSGVLALDRGRGMLNGLAPVTVSQAYASRVELYTAELQQLMVAGRHSLIAGARGQWSHQNVEDQVANPIGDNRALLGTNNPVSAQDEAVNSWGVSLYAYDNVRLTDTLQVVGGLNYTYQVVPVNTATAPVSSSREHQNQLNPKAGIIWSPATATRVRASYTKSLTGSGFGQSVRLEPTQVAGSPQFFRAPVPFSLVGELDGADLETAEVVWDGQFHDTYLSVGAQWLVAERDRYLGLYLSHVDYDPPPSLGLIAEDVHFRERGLDFSAHQLISDEWSLGVRYRLGYARLKRSFPEYPGLGVDSVDDNTDWQGWLHTLSLGGLYRHHSGFFTRAEGVLFAQDRERDGSSAPGDNFWEVNLIAGYRFPKQRAEIAVGVLNVFDTDYRLDPINPYAEQPRSRTFYARLLINF